MGQTKREGSIWHNLGGNTIIYVYMNNNKLLGVFSMLSFKAKLNCDNRHDYLI